MIERAFIQVVGPEGAGKTTFIERVLERAGPMVSAARCVREEGIPDLEESAPRGDAELDRYRAAGAFGVASIRFSEVDAGGDAFYMTGLMEKGPSAVVIEGDAPVHVDLRVHVAPPPARGGTLLVRVKRDRAREAREKVAALERLLEEPGGLRELVESLVEGEEGREMVMAEMRAGVEKEVAEARRAPPPAPTEHWAIADGYRGIELAQVVVVNARTDRERERGEGLLGALQRLRKDKELFREVARWRAKRLPITGVVADLADGGDPGTRKAVARVRRTIPRRW